MAGLKRLLGNKFFLLGLQLFSLLCISRIWNVLRPLSLQLHNQYPLIVCAFVAIMLFGVLSKAKYSLFIGFSAYVALFVAYAIKINIYMPGFYTFKMYFGGSFEPEGFYYGLNSYIYFFTALILLLIMFGIYARKFYLLRRAEKEPLSL